MQYAKRFLNRYAQLQAIQKVKDKLYARDIILKFDKILTNATN